MPQMSPMMWTMLLMSITFMIMQTNSLNFFSFIKTKKEKKKMSKKNWKW